MGTKLSSKASATVIALVAMFFGCVVCIGMIDGDNPSRPPSNFDLVMDLQRGRKVVPVVGSWIACSDEDYYAKMVEARGRGDKQGFARFAMEGAAAGLCAALNDGDRVYVEDVAVWSELALVRPAGATRSYWVHAMALDASQAVDAS